MAKIFKSVKDIVLLKKNGKKNLGSGSFSQVKLVYHASNPRTLYAMKELIKRNNTEMGYIKKEIKLHRNLSHPNIIKLVDYLETETKVYIFLEYAKHGDLFHFLRKNKNLRESLLLSFFFQTCLAIKYIHSKNIMHRDLKPENILLDQNLSIKICDFGWSAEYRDTEVRKTLCGTYEYMAPEVFFKKK